MGSRYIYNIYNTYLSFICFCSLFHYAATSNHTNHPTTQTTQTPRLARPRLRNERNENATKTERRTSFLRFYLTGHSLGGGLAKLVALEVGKKSAPRASPQQFGAIWWGWWLDDFKLALFFWVDGSGMTVKKKQIWWSPTTQRFFFSVFFLLCDLGSSWVMHWSVYLGRCFFFVIWWWVDLIFGVFFWMSRDVVHGSKITWTKQRCGEFTVAAVSNLWLYMIIPFIPHALINQFTVIVVHKCERQCHFPRI